MAPRTWLALAALCVLFGVLLHGSASDRAAFLAFNALGPWAPTLWSCVSALGLGLSMVLLLALDGPQGAERLARGLLAVLMGGVLVQSLKHGLALPRPAAVLDADALQVIGITLGGRAMPSGHAAVAGAMVVLWLQGWAGFDRLARAQALCAVVLAALIAVSRLAVGAHWPSDVWVGLGLGMAVATSVSAVPTLSRLSRAMALGLRGRAGSRLAAGGVVCAAAALWVGERELPLAEPVHVVLPLLALLAALRWWRLHGAVHPVERAGLSEKVSSPLPSTERARVVALKPERS